MQYSSSRTKNSTFRTFYAASLTLYTYSHTLYTSPCTLYTSFYILHTFPRTLYKYFILNSISVRLDIQFFYFASHRPLDTLTNTISNVTVVHRAIQLYRVMDSHIKMFIQKGTVNDFQNFMAQPKNVRTVYITSALSMLSSKL